MVIDSLSGPDYNWGDPSTQGRTAIGSLVENIAYCQRIPVCGCDQVLLLVQVSGACQPVLQLQFSSDGDNWWSEIVEELGALTAAERRFTCTTKAWGPLPAGWYAIPRPASAHFLRVGLYATVSVASTDFIHLVVERQIFGQLQAQSAV